MGNRVAGMRCILTGAAALLVGVVVGLFGCDRSGDQTVVARDPSAAPPSTEDATLPAEEVRKDVERIPDLGMGQAVKLADEVWSKYSNGMMIYDIRPGSGIRPQPGQTMHVHYKGTFPNNGQVFDQSLDKPFEFVLGTKNIIEGWNLAISTMQVGGKRKVLIPSKLAYGANGSLPLIHPNQDLMFEIELLSVTGRAVSFPETKPADTQALLAPAMGPSTGPAKPK